MADLTDPQTARRRIKEFKSTVETKILTDRVYHPFTQPGKRLEDLLVDINPMIYGSIGDREKVELRGLEYVIDRLPRGIEECRDIQLATKEELRKRRNRITPPKRRRHSYRDKYKRDRMYFEVTRGISEIYDIVTHLTFLNIEAKKIARKAESNPEEWKSLEEKVLGNTKPEGDKLSNAIKNLKPILGRDGREIRTAYNRLQNNAEKGHNNGLFNIIYWLGKTMLEEQEDVGKSRLIECQERLNNLIGVSHQYGTDWATRIKNKIFQLGLKERPVHIISSNMHSVMNLLYGFNGYRSIHPKSRSIYGMAAHLFERTEDVRRYAETHGLYYLKDSSGTNIDCQVIDTSKLDLENMHPSVSIDKEYIQKEKPILIVMDYAFGEQAYEVMGELLKPIYKNGRKIPLNVKSISMIGKAGILPEDGSKGDTIIPTTHILEGEGYIKPLINDFSEEDFDKCRVFVGPMVTAPGTSLQNEHILWYFTYDYSFGDEDRNAKGIEMEGYHYQNAIDTAKQRGCISEDVPVRYAYYASDNPLKTGHTLAFGGLGKEGIRPTYMITNAILKKITSN